MNPGGTGTKHLETYFINSIQGVPNKTLVCLWRLIILVWKHPNWGKYTIPCMAYVCLSSGLILVCYAIPSLGYFRHWRRRRSEDSLMQGVEESNRECYCPVAVYFVPHPPWFISIYPQLNWNYKWSQWIYLILQYRSLTLTLPSF